MNDRLTIAHKKATQALHYFARQEGLKINKIKALKLLFFADRYHLRKFGRLVSECGYFAMTHGPVASEAKAIAEEASQLPAAARVYARQFLQKQGPYDCATRAEADHTVFSASDQEALEFAWKNFGHFSKYQLWAITHHYPERKRHEPGLASARRIPMDLTDFFKEPAAGYIPCHALSREEREAGQALFRQRCNFDQHWS